jgi:trans-2,3-dihydro-3-hydroxyanthranilate isomerase
MAEMMSDLAAPLEYRHVDVFSEMPFGGNGLIVAFAGTGTVSSEALVTLTAEMRQFELIVVDAEPRGGRVWARIFTAQEELPFAGHPVIGAAAALHERDVIEATCSWLFVIAGREIAVRSERTEHYYRAEMNQGSPDVRPPLNDVDAARFAGALDLREDDLHRLPMRIVSTGLPYLIVPVSGGLERARIVVEDFERRLASVGAKFVYVFDPDRREGRTWDNAGAIEDVATGSAAGPAAAYLAAHGLVTQGGPIVIHQGRFLGRPSRIMVTPDSQGELWVGGQVAPVARGVVDAPFAGG